MIIRDNKYEVEIDIDVTSLNRNIREYQYFQSFVVDERIYKILRKKLYTNGLYARWICDEDLSTKIFEIDYNKMYGDFYYNRSLYILLRKALINILDRTFGVDTDKTLFDDVEIIDGTYRNIARLR